MKRSYGSTNQPPPPPPPSYQSAPPLPPGPPPPPPQTPNPYPAYGYAYPPAAAPVAQSQHPQYPGYGYGVSFFCDEGSRTAAVDSHLSCLSSLPLLLLPLPIHTVIRLPRRTLLRVTRNNTQAMFLLPLTPKRILLLQLISLSRSLRVIHHTPRRRNLTLLFHLSLLLHILMDLLRFTSTLQSSKRTPPRRRSRSLGLCRDHLEERRLTNVRDTTEGLNLLPRYHR